MPRLITGVLNEVILMSSALPAKRLPERWSEGSVPGKTQRLSSCRRTHTAPLTTCPVIPVRQGGRHIGLGLPDIISSWSSAECGIGRNTNRDPWPTGSDRTYRPSKGFAW